MLPVRMVEIRYYVASANTEPFANWFAELDPTASAKVTRAIARVQQGNFSNVKSVGERRVGIQDRFRAGLPDLFWARRRQDRDLADGRNEEAAATGRRYGKGLLAGLQTEQARVALNGDQRWQKPNRLRTWCRPASERTKNSRRRFFAKASMPC